MGLGVSPPATTWLTVYDGKAPAGGVTVLVVPTAVDAVLLAADHRCDVAALVQLQARCPLNLEAARERLGRRAGQVVVLPHDQHLAVGGPIAWHALQSATRDACRALTAAALTRLLARRQQLLDPLAEGDQ